MMLTQPVIVRADPERAAPSRAAGTRADGPAETSGEYIAMIYHGGMSRESGRSAGDYALLGLLDAQPLTGYQLRARVRAALSHFWNASFGTIYPALARLERDDLIRRTPGSGARGSQPFAITAAGRKVLRQWLGTAPADDPGPRSELLLKLFFGRSGDPAALLSMLDDYARTQRQRREHLDATITRVSNQDSDDTFFWRLTAQRGLAVADARIAWAHAARRAIAARQRHARRKA